MLEKVHRSLYDESYQKGFEIGISKSSFQFLTGMVKSIKAYLSEERWERYKKSQEKKHRKYIAEHPGSAEGCHSCYDNDGCLIKEKWVKEEKIILNCLGFQEECWADIISFIEKYPELSASAIARRIVRESEYKYI